MLPLLRFEIEACGNNVKLPCNGCGESLKGHAIRVIVTIGGGMHARKAVFCNRCGGKLADEIADNMNNVAHYLNRGTGLTIFAHDLRILPKLVAMMPNADRLRPKTAKDKAKLR